MKELLSSLWLIDDDPFVNIYNRAVIKSQKVTEHLFDIDSAKEALELLLNPSTTIPDLIFVDINMPVMNGWEFVEELQKHEKFDGLKIIVLSASSNPDDIERVGQYDNVSSFISKPLSAAKLKEELGKLQIRSVA